MHSHISHIKAFVFLRTESLTNLCKHKHRHIGVSVNPSKSVHTHTRTQREICAVRTSDFYPFVKPNPNPYLKNLTKTN